MTQTSALMGSPLYMSPEQMASSKTVDARSDVWALGVVLYEMLSGTPPFNAATLPQVCNMIMSRAPQPLVERVPNLPASLVAVVERCLQKDPEARFQSVAEFAQALLPLTNVRGQQSVERISRVLGVQPVPAKPSAPPPAHTLLSSASVAATRANPGTTAPWSDTKPQRAKSPSRAALWGALVFLCTLSLGVGLWFSRRSPSTLPVAQAASAPALQAPSAAPPVVAVAAVIAPSERPSAAPPSAAPPSAAPPSAAPPSAAPPSRAARHAAPVAKVAPTAIAKVVATPAAQPALAEAPKPTQPSKAVVIPSAAPSATSAPSKVSAPPFRSRL